MTMERSVMYATPTYRRMCFSIKKWNLKHLKFQEQDFDWSSQDRGLILSSFFWGYIFTQFAGGVFAKRFGGNLVCF